MKQSHEERSEFLRVLSQKENNLAELVGSFKHSFTEIITTLKHLNTRMEQVETKVEKHYEKWLEGQNKK
jgi:flagellar motility protein MotE (MotC chaperone)